MSRTLPFPPALIAGVVVLQAVTSWRGVAAESLWVGPSGGNWSVPGHWTNGVPNRSDATINGGIAVLANEAVTTEVGHLVVGASSADRSSALGISSANLLTSSLTIGRDAGVTGLVSFGSGSRATLATLVVADRGSGVLSITGTADVTAVSPVVFAREPDSEAQLILTGGTFVSLGRMDAALAGHADISITNGGDLLVINGSLTIGALGGTATMNVAGSDSSVSAEVIRISSSASITVTESASVGAALLELGPGQWTLGTGARLIGRTDLRFAPDTRMTLLLDGTGSHGRISAIDLQLGGTLAISLEDGFVPRVGLSFDLWDATNVTGMFDVVDLPSLADGLAWNTDELASTGTLRVGVIPEPQLGWAAIALGGLHLIALMRRNAGRNAGRKR